MLIRGAHFFSIQILYKLQTPMPCRHRLQRAYPRLLDNSFLESHWISLCSSSVTAMQV